MVRLSNPVVAKLEPRDRKYDTWDSELKGFVVRTQPTGRKVYYVAYRLADGKRNWEKIGPHGTLTTAQARDQAKDVLAGVTKGIDPAAARKAAKAHNLKSFIEQVYQPWAESHRKDGKATVRRIMACFDEFHGKRLTEITPWIAEKWRAKRLKSGTAPETINRDVTALKAALSKAVEWGIIADHPLAKMRPLKVDRAPITRYLTGAEECRLREALDTREERIRLERDRANSWRRDRGYPELPDLRTEPFADHLAPMVLLSTNTGLRRGEMFHLRWADVNLGMAILTVAGASAKSGQSRHVPLNAEALDTITRWKSQSADQARLVFPGKEGRPLDNVRKAWAALLADAEITAFRWHDMRHTFASKLVMAGVDLNTVRELLGHGDLKMTLRYAHLAPAHTAAAVERLVAAR